MTNDPDPVGNQVQFKVCFLLLLTELNMVHLHLQRQALLKAIDLRQSGVELEVVPIPREGTHFNISAFCEVHCSISCKYLLSKRLFTQLSIYLFKTF